jgi:hypothetical protein
MRYGIGASLLKNDNALVLPAILLILNALDVLSTIYGLSRGALEMNPLFSYAVIPGKFLCCGILFITASIQNKLNPKARYVNITILSVTIIYLFVIGNNTLSILNTIL